MSYKIFTVFDERCNLQEIYEFRLMTLRGFVLEDQGPEQGNPRIFMSSKRLQVQRGYRDVRSQRRSARRAMRVR